MVQVCNLSDGENVYHTCSNIYLTNIILILLLLLSCSIAICYIRWCLLLMLIGPKVIFLLLPGSPAPLLLPSNFSTKNKKSCRVVFCSSGSLSTSSRISSYACLQYPQCLVSLQCLSQGVSMIEATL